VRTSTIRVPTNAHGMAVYEAIPDNPRAAAIVIQEAYGVNDYIERVARDLAEEGYHAVAPHLFHRTGGEVVPYDDVSKAIEMIGTLSDETILADIDATLVHLRNAGFADSSIGIVGFCMGGRVTFLTVARRPIGAGVGFYGGAIVTGWPPKLAALIGEADSLKAPWLGLFGDQDASIPVEQVEQLREALKEATVDTEIVRYPNAGHAFHSEPRASFVPEAAADAWTRTVDWFTRYLS
jgi:carboxymethylenebutenolidase